MIIEIATLFKAQVQTGLPPPIAVNPWALGAALCCVTLLIWWARVQCDSRCSDCGYCPVWCKCDTHTRHRSR